MGSPLAKRARRLAQLAQNEVGQRVDTGTEADMNRAEQEAAAMLQRAYAAPLPHGQVGQRDPATGAWRDGGERLRQRALRWAEETLARFKR